MNQIEKMRRDASWLRDVPNMPDVAARIEWAANEIEGLRGELREALEVLHQCERYIAADESAHGRQFGDGNAVRAILAKHATGPVNVGEI